MIAGILLELLILAWCYFNYSEPGDVFRCAARYSGRLSFVVYAACFMLFAITTKNKTERRSGTLRNALLIFSILHVIHFGFLATNVQLNNVPLETPKVIGGALTYGLIVVFPWLPGHFREKRWINYVYFYWVGLVMALTFLARIKGEFQGADPAVFHYFGIGTTALLYIALPTYLSVRKKVAT